MRKRSGDSRISFAEFHEVDTGLLQVVRPEVVISSLLARRFDCVDLAQRLHDLGFKGKYRVLTDALPCPEMVLGELRSLFPGLDIEIDPIPAHLSA
ncbi:hypothetical protein [Roseitranquillus sediminis]|uniref:hypothetical protein n=1 Tax=Roseitranquillus sediminis TaxID=2809051 RepID=UPI001D0CD684|nr:hypothetical protein [Roseitranquillus sediminis]MBM9595605.1 hypothetical protein [Roseitranquillus sediminis]